MTNATKKKAAARHKAPRGKSPAAAPAARHAREGGAVAGLPKGWQVKQLMDIGEFSKGKGITKEDLRHKGFPCVRYGDIYTKHDYVIRSFSSYIDKKTAEHCKTINCNSLLFAGSGETADEIGKCVAFNMNIEAYAGGDVIMLTIDTADKAEYISYFLNSVGRQQLNKLGEGNSVTHIYSRYLKSVNIPLPPLSEQKSIASLLEKWNEAIEKTERLISEKQKRFDWLLDRLVNAPAQGNKPGWKSVRIKQLLEEDIKIEKGKPLTKKTASEGDIPVVASGQTYAYYVDSATHTIPTVTISASGDAGFVSMHDYPIWASDCNVLYAVNGITQFLYYALKTAQNKIYSLQSGSAHRHVYAKDIMHVSIPWTSSIKEQKRVTAALLKAQRDIDILREIAQKYRVQKHGLMQKLLTGQWRIK